MLPLVTITIATLRDATISPRSRLTEVYPPDNASGEELQSRFIQSGPIGRRHDGPHILPPPSLILVRKDVGKSSLVARKKSNICSEAGNWSRLFSVAAVRCRHSVHQQLLGSVSINPLAVRSETKSMMNGCANIMQFSKCCIILFAHTRDMIKPWLLSELFSIRWFRE